MNNQSQEVTFRDFLSRVNPGYMEVVPDRSANTLLPIINSVIRHDIDITIHSDQWAAYNRINDILS